MDSLVPEFIEHGFRAPSMRKVRCAVGCRLRSDSCGHSGMGCLAVSARIFSEHRIERVAHVLFFESARLCVDDAATMAVASLAACSLCEFVFTVVSPYTVTVTS